MTQPAINLNSYHNTTNYEGEELRKREGNARLQENRILAMFQDRQLHSPSEIWEAYNALYKTNIPLTSPRRAITNLSTDRKLKSGLELKAKLRKTDQFKTGIYNAREYFWELI